MTLKNAALLALIGMSLLTLLLLVGFINNLVALANGVIPPTVFVSSMIHAFAALSVAVFFLTFHRTQSRSGI
jgi:hypothetical protein